MRALPSFDPRNKSEGMQAQDEGGVHGEVVSNPVVSLLSNHGDACGPSRLRTKAACTPNLLERLDQFESIA